MITTGAVIEQPTGFFTITAAEESSEVRQTGSNAFLRKIKQSPPVVSLNLKPEDYIAFQMSFVPEVENVFVSRHEGEVLHVLTVVNNRDRELNRRIFARERAIMDYYRQCRFDFHILPRMNRNLNDVMAPTGKRVLEGK